MVTINLSMCVCVLDVHACYAQRDLDILPPINLSMYVCWVYITHVYYTQCDLDNRHHWDSLMYELTHICMIGTVGK